MSTSMMKTHPLAGGTMIFTHSAVSICRTRAYSSHDQRSFSTQHLQRAAGCKSSPAWSSGSHLHNPKRGARPAPPDVKPWVRMCSDYRFWLHNPVF
jgi:hypothetical protein